VNPLPEVVRGRQPSESERRWAETTLAEALARQPEKPIGAATGNESGRGRGARFTTSREGHPEAVQPARICRGLVEEKYLGYPGEAPYTRGIHPTGYRGKLWTMRQFSGLPHRGDQPALPLSAGAWRQRSLGGLRSADPDGLRSDHAFSEGEVGKCGVAIDSLEDMEILSAHRPGEDDGLDDDQLSGERAVAMYLVVAEKQGADWKKISGTLQNDILKEYIAQKEYIYPPAESMRLVIDTFEFGSKYTPRFNTISISGYTSARRARRPCRSWHSPFMTGWNTWSGRGGVGWTWTSSAHG